MLTVVALLIAVTGAVWWGLSARGAFRLGSLARLVDVEPGDTPLPRLSVVVPARNEAGRIEAAFASLQAQDYPDLELIPVDDRSDDGTGEAIARLAAGDPRIHRVRIDSLPEGWLGKVHALETGFAAATGEFVLFTDADVHFAPGALRRAVALAALRRLDHLAGLPSIMPAGIVTDLLALSFLRPLLTVAVRPWKVADPRSRDFCGVGAFNMVRRGALADAGGLEWLRMEIGEDMGLGLLMKRSGKRCDVVAAAGQVSVRWLASPAEALRAAERADATVLGGSPPLALAVIVGGPLMELAPLWLLLLAPAIPWAGPAGLLLLVIQAGSCAGAALRLRVPVAAALLSPLGSLAASLGYLRAMIVARRRGGVVWRGTLYPREQLRAGSRIGIGRAPVK